MQRRLLPRQSHVFFLALLLGLFLLVWKVFSPFIIYMVTGVFVAVLALPLARRLTRKLPKRLAAFMTMGIILLGALVPMTGLGLALANDAQELTKNIQDGKVDEWVENALNNSIVQDLLALSYPEETPTERNETLRNLTGAFQDRFAEQLINYATDVAQKLPDFFIAITIILFVVYYVLTDGERLIAYIRRASPLPSKQVDFILGEARQGLRGVFVGQILTSIIQGALGGVGFLIAGLPGVFVWAAVMAVLSLLPIVGAFLVWVPAAIFLLLVGDIWQGIFLAIWGIVVVSQIDNFIRPKLIGDRAQIHPIFVLVGVLGGVAAFGFIGLFLGPVLVGITLSVLKVWEKEYLDPEVGAEDPTVE